jgi:hypothetical protein
MMIGRKEKVSYIAVDTMPSLIDAREGPTNIPTLRPARYERANFSKGKTLTAQLKWRPHDQ